MSDAISTSGFKIFNEAVVKEHLNNASLFLLTWELLKWSIIDNVKDYICMEWKTVDEKLIQIESEGYKTRVLSLDRDRLKASCLYSIEMGVITEEDYCEVLRLREARNEIAHELVKILLENEYHINNRDILSMKSLVEKIDRWWVINVEIATDPDILTMDRDAIDWDCVASDRMIVLRYLLNSYMK